MLSAARDKKTDTLHGSQHIVLTETSNKKMTAYYDPSNWWSHLFSCQGSVVPGIIPQLILFTGWAVLVRGMEDVLDWKPDQIDMTVHSIAGTALGLLLVFRTNTAYDRFWEGRKKWGMIINRTRDLARQTLVYINNDSVVQTITRHIIVFAYACRMHLRGKNDISDAEDILVQSEIDSYYSSDHLPLHSHVIIAREIRDARDRGEIGSYVLFFFVFVYEAFSFFVCACRVYYGAST